MKYMSLD